MAWWHVLKKKHFAFQPPIRLKILTSFKKKTGVTKQKRSPKLRILRLFFGIKLCQPKKSQESGVNGMKQSNHEMPFHLSASDFELQRRLEKEKTLTETKLWKGKDVP